jgi:hypothetical protein
MFCRYGVAMRTTRMFHKTAAFPRLLRIEDFAPTVVVCKPRNRPIRRIEIRKEKTRIDDTLSRTHIWKTLFGTEPMPEIEENAAEKYSGTLSFPDDFDFDRILRKVRKGH